MTTMDNSVNKRLNEELSEEEYNGKIMREFLEEAENGGFSDPELDHAHHAAEYFQMTEVMTMIRELRVYSLKVRGEVYRKILSKLGDEDFTIQEANLSIE